MRLFVLSRVMVNCALTEIKTGVAEVEYDSPAPYTDIAPTCLGKVRAISFAVSKQRKLIILVFVQEQQPHWLEKSSVLGSNHILKTFFGTGRVRWSHQQQFCS